MVKIRSRKARVPRVRVYAWVVVRAAQYSHTCQPPSPPPPRTRPRAVERVVLEVSLGVNIARQ